MSYLRVPNFKIYKKEEEKLLKWSEEIPTVTEEPEGSVQDLRDWKTRDNGQ